MRRIFLFIISLFTILPLAGARNAVPVNRLTVTVVNLRNNKGHVLVSLYKDGEGFPDNPEKAYRKSSLAIENGVAVVAWDDLPAGHYAVAILHDENDDLKMNTNFFGIPKEGYGFSNNVTGMFGPPSFSRASFTWTADYAGKSEIKARY